MNAHRQSAVSLLAATMAFVLAVGLTAETRAGYYAYSEQQTSSYVFNGVTVGAITPLSSTSGAQVANPTGNESHSGGLDALQSYVGPARPAENTFTPLGQVNPDFVRGDALITVSPSLTTNNVAEGFLNGPGNSAGSGSWSFSAPITLSAAGTVTLGFTYSNILTLVNAPTASAPTGTVAADYGYNFSIQNGSGITIFSSSPNAVNRSLSLVLPGSSSTPGSGSLSITSGTLAAGTYTATVSGSEHVFLSAVPEPGSVALMAIGVAALTGGAIRKRLFPARA